MRETLRIDEEPATAETLAAYAKVSIAFRVESRLRVSTLNAGLDGIQLVPESVAEPYVKDYDLDEGEAPTQWEQRWNLSNWGILVAYQSDQRVGGAVLAFRTHGLNFLEGRTNLAALWDMRVSPEARGKGLGSELFRRAVNWASVRHCRLLKIETQNVNVAACRFYAGGGCQLGGINRFAYLGQYGSAHPDEVQLLWYYELTSPPLESGA